MKHIETGGTMPLSAFRKVSIGNWRHPRDPQTYTEVELNVEPALAFLKQQQGERPLSLTHFVHLLDFIKYTLNVATPTSLPRDRFGTVIITNIGALGLQNALVPLTPCARTPLLVAVGSHSMATSALFPMVGKTVLPERSRIRRRSGIASATPDLRMSTS